MILLVPRILIKIGYNTLVYDRNAAGLEEKKMELHPTRYCMSTVLAETVIRQSSLARDRE
jgi:hypothetical protein